MNTQILLYSISSALLLSLVALGFNLIFNATKVFHLAHGGLYVAAVVAMQYFNGLLRSLFSPVVALIIALLLSLLLLVVLITVIEYAVYRPLYLKKVNPAISLISSLGVYIFIVNGLIFLFGNESVSLDKSYHIVFSNSYFKLTQIEIIQCGVCLVCIAFVFLFSRTSAYTHIRAVTGNYQVAEKFGINIQRTRLIALILGTVLPGLAGILKGYEIAVEPNAGLTIVLSASVAVIIGGVTSLKGTVIACFVIALIDNYSVKFLSPQWKDLVIYTLLIAVLLFYKKGLVAVKQRIETT